MWERRGVVTYAGMVLQALTAGASSKEKLSERDTETRAQDEEEGEPRREVTGGLQ